MELNTLPTKRSELRNLSSLCLKMERYEDMIHVVNRLFHLNCDLEKEERNYFSIAYKNVFGAKRIILRTINSLLIQEESKKNNNIVNLEGNIEVLKTYKSLVANEQKDLCYSGIKLIEKHLSSIKSKETLAFFFKMFLNFYLI
jgi:hypothetical protein